LSEEPLQVVVNADSAESLDTATAMLSNLAATVDAAYARWDGSRKATSARHGGAHRWPLHVDDNVLQSRATEILASNLLETDPSRLELK
jgi:hypothetical protein